MVGPMVAEPDYSAILIDRYKWLRRAAYLVAMLGALAFLVYAFRQTPDPTEGKADDPAIVQQIPEPGSNILHQQTVGLLLKDGYEGRITVDGKTIPEDQMEGAIPPSSPEYQADLGPRPNTKNNVTFRPGKGKVFTRWPGGQITISVRYWKISAGQRHAKVLTWVVSTT